MLLSEDDELEDDDCELVELSLDVEDGDWLDGDLEDEDELDDELPLLGD